MFFEAVIGSIRMVTEKFTDWAAAPICISSSMKSISFFKLTNVKNIGGSSPAGIPAACQNFVILPFQLFINQN
jgi:hypothetical protein